jgi:hypothetical protein
VDNITAVVGGESPLANGVLGYGSGSEDSECVTPFSIPHFTIRGFIHDSTGPRYDIPVRMLIDCGSSTVLMRSEIATALGLRRRRLPASLKLDSAWGSEGTIVTEYVQLRFSLRSFAWTFRSVRCLLVDELCAPIILGMPFLSHNDLIISFSSRKCVDSCTGFDLLNPSYKRACSPVAPSPTHAKCRSCDENAMEQASIATIAPHISSAPATPDTIMPNLTSARPLISPLTSSELRDTAHPDLFDSPPG